jgi:hypothetical protein
MKSHRVISVCKSTQRVCTKARYREGIACMCERMLAFFLRVYQCIYVRVCSHTRTLARSYARAHPHKHALTHPMHTPSHWIEHEREDVGHGRDERRSRTLNVHTYGTYHKRDERRTRSAWPQTRGPWRWCCFVVPCPESTCVCHMRREYMCMRM